MSLRERLIRNANRDTESNLLMTPFLMNPENPASFSLVIERRSMFANANG